MDCDGTQLAPVALVDAAGRPPLTREEVETIYLRGWTLIVRYFHESDSLRNYHVPQTGRMHCASGAMAAPECSCDGADVTIE